MLTMCKGWGPFIRRGPPAAPAGHAGRWHQSPWCATPAPTRQSGRRPAHAQRRRPSRWRLRGGLCRSPAALALGRRPWRASVGRSWGPRTCAAQEHVVRCLAEFHTRSDRSRRCHPTEPIERRQKCVATALVLFASLLSPNTPITQDRGAFPDSHSQPVMAKATRAFGHCLMGFVGCGLK